MTYILVAAGPEEYIPPLSHYKEQYPDAVWIGVDRGAYYLLLQDIIPNQAFGDFDSLSDTEREELDKANIKLSLYPSEKDASDLEIAIDWTMNENPDKVIILGATGGRLDHFLLNVQLLHKGLSQNIWMTIVDKGNRIMLKEPGEYHIRKSDFTYTSFLPISSEVTGIHLSGFRYTLNNIHLKQGSSLCISNELKKEVGQISFKTGKLLIMESNDLS